MATRSRYEGYANGFIRLQKSNEEKQKVTQQMNQQKNFSTRESVLARLKELKGNPGIVRVPIEAGDNNA